MNDKGIVFNQNAKKIANNEEHQEMQDCGISEEEIMRVCSAHDDCSDCPLNDYCGEEFADE